MKKIPQQICPIFLVLMLTFFTAPQSMQAGLPAPHAPFRTLADTPAFAIPFVISPNGMYNSWGISFGIHAGATKGIDPFLGEVEYPPFPPCCALMLLMTAGGNAILDLRPYSNSAQIDTYKIGVSAEVATYPMTFSWPNINSYYSGSVRLKSDVNGLFDIDMKSRTSFTLATGPAIDDNNLPPSGLIPSLVFYIIAEGPLTGTAMPVVTTYGVGNGGFQALVFAPTSGTESTGSIFANAGSVTNVWFESGPTKSYGTSSASQFVDAGTNVDIIEPFDPSSLPPNTRLHFRAVAQNSLGTFYGGDRVVSNGTPPPEPIDSSGLVMYRTASYRDWADAIDQKGKRVALKWRPDKVDFRFVLHVPPPSSGNSDPFTKLRLVFNMAVQNLLIFRNRIVTDTIFCSPTIVRPSDWKYDFSGCPPIPDSVEIKGRGLKGKPIIVTYYWTTQTSQTNTGMRGSLPGKPRRDDVIKENILRYPMPNLHNVGEGIYGGVSQTPVNIIVGANEDTRGAHTVCHPKYKDVLKSLFKDYKTSILYHTAAPHWLNIFDNGRRFTRQQKSLPPDKHNNLLFAEQLTLKLNVAASDSGIFPKGFGDLIYTNATPFDNLSIRQIIAEVDLFLGHPPEPPEAVTDSSIYLKIAQDLNTAFEGPMDTISWSAGKVICTPVRMLQDVPYLSAPPGGIPGVTLPMRGNTSASRQPEGIRLDPNWPNPFNPTTTISFTLPEDALITIRIYNSVGQEVTTLADRELFSNGYNDVEFDGSKLASGVYFYRVQASRPGDQAVIFTGVRKMLLLK